MTSLPAWSKEEDAFLVECINGGMSYAQAAAAISGRFSRTRSRNSAIGRANRLGMQSPPPPRKAKPQPWAEAGMAKRTWHRHRQYEREGRENVLARERERHGARSRQQFSCEEMAKLRNAKVEPLRVALMDLKSESCRWPYGDLPPFSFCGHLAMGGHSYCPAHFALSVGRGTPSERAADRASTGRPA